MYEIFEHTADLGIRVEAHSFEELLVEAATALTSVLVTNPESIEPERRVHLALDATEPEDQFLDWLSELLYRFSAERMLFSRFEIARSMSDGRVEAEAWGEPIDPARHQIDTEIKAITYHRLKVEQHSHGWTAEVIVDL